MHSYLISGGTKEQRVKRIDKLLASWNVHSFDRYAVLPEEGKNQIGITSIRSLKQQLSRIPRSSTFHAGIIQNAETLTIPAQNALLKLLEEPPSGGKIILETKNPQSLIPTILSRLEIQTVQHDTKKPKGETVLDLLSCIDGKSLGEILCFVDKHLSKKEEALHWITQTLPKLAEQLEQSPSKQTAHTIRALLKAERCLTLNVNYTLVMDDLFLAVKT